MEEGQRPYSWSKSCVAVCARFAVRRPFLFCFLCARSWLWPCCAQFAAPRDCGPTCGCTYLLQLLVFAERPAAWVHRWLGRAQHRDAAIAHCCVCVVQAVCRAVALPLGLRLVQVVRLGAEAQAQEGHSAAAAACARVAATRCRAAGKDLVDTCHHGWAVMCDACRGLRE